MSLSSEHGISSGGYDTNKINKSHIAVEVQGNGGYCRTIEL